LRFIYQRIIDTVNVHKSALTEDRKNTDTE